jgi:opacity protein-like surface antigen
MPPLMAQSETQTKITLTFQNEKLSSVLQQISEKAGVNFSYDAGDPVFDMPVTYSAEQENVDVVLKDILSQAGLKYEHIGKQTVILHAQEEPEPPAPAPVIQNEQPEPEKSTESAQPERITEYILDTIFLHDTIVRIDTIRVTDTVFVEKEKPQKQTPSKVKELPVDFFQSETIRDKGWAIGLFVAPLLDDFSMVKDQKSFSLRSFSLGVDALKLLKRWNLQFGLRLTQFDHRFTQQYNQNEGGFFDTDTIDTYYTVTDLDTTWYYVTDSSWVPVEIREYNYQHTNTLGYLVFNVSASFDIYQDKKMRIYLKAGGELDWLMYKDGLAIFGEDQKETTDFDDLGFNTINYAFSLGTGLKYRLADKVDFNTELYYTRHLNELVPDVPLDTHINAVGLKLGLVFYF